MTLIEQLQKAEGPSRELDADIFEAAGNPLPEKFVTADINLEREGDHYICPHGDFQFRYEQPAYTSSIDAALTLVPDGWCWDADAIAPECGVDWFIYSDGHRQESKGTGATPALAICAPALKARENNDG